MGYLIIIVIFIVIVVLIISKKKSKSSSNYKSSGYTTVSKSPAEIRSMMEKIHDSVDFSDTDKFPIGSSGNLIYERKRKERILKEKNNK